MNALVTALGIASGGALTAGLAVPVLREKLIGNINQDWLANELEFDHILNDRKTIVLKDDRYLSVYQLSGMLYESKDENHQQNLAVNRAGALKILAELVESVRLFGIKRKKPIEYNAEWPTPVLNELGNRESAQFSEGYDIEWFIMLCSPNLQKLNTAGERLTGYFTDYKPHALKHPEDHIKPCPLTRFLNYLITGELDETICSVHHNISLNIRGCDLQFNKDGVLITQTPLTNYHKIITTRYWPEELTSKLHARLLSLRGDIEVCHILKPLNADLEKTRAVFLARQDQYGVLSTGSRAEEYNSAISLLNEGNTCLFETQYQIAVRAEDQETLDQLVRKITEHLARMRIIFSIETAAMPICWYQRFPYRNRLLRPLKLFGEVVAVLWNFAGSPTGLSDNPWDQRPVRLFLTPSGQTYRFQFHCSPKPQSLGHYVVIAPSGSGKSTLILHLLGGLAKINGVKSYIFDSKEGTRFMVEAMGGCYQNYEKLALNPLDVGGDTPANRQIINSVMLSMLGELALTPEIEDELDHAIHTAFMVKPPARTLNTIFKPAFSKYEAVRAAMAKWVVDDKGKIGAYSHVFNSPQDSLAGILDQDFMVGINMNEALDDPILGPPIVTHISQMISRVAAKKSKGFAIFVDEAAKLMENDGFKSSVKEMFREFRKLDGVVGLAFQEPGAIKRTGISDIIQKNIATFFFFPDPQGNAEDYEPFRLNQEELDFILGRLGEEGDGAGRRVLVIKRDSANDVQESAILNIGIAH